MKPVEEIARDFRDAVREMRRCQADYFRTRSKDALIASKEAERRVDAMLGEKA